MTTFTTPGPARHTHAIATTGRRTKPRCGAIGHRILSSVGCRLRSASCSALIGAVISSVAMGFVIASWPTTMGGQVLGRWLEGSPSLGRSSEPSAR